MRNVIGFRALIALAASLVITFTRPDTAALGLAIFAGFALLHGLGSLAVGFTRKTSSASKTTSQLPSAVPLRNFVPQAIVALIAATAALLALGGSTSAKLAALQITVMGYLVLTAALHTYLASLSGFKTVEGRENLIAAGLAEAITIIFVLLNPEPLNASGFLGAYFALSAVHQGIWAASPTKAD